MKTKELVIEFEQFLRGALDCQLEDRLLVAVSGGLDSVVLAELCHRLGQAFGLAHCNFQLRGAEADGDAQFVAALAQRYGVPLHLQSFETKTIQQQQKGSIQMLARQLRYDWFEEIRADADYAYIATAHHQDDAAETMLLNLTKGCGLRGLQGIPAKNGHVIRPLLCTNRAAIAAFVQTEGIAYREDASNASDAYQRNFLRHHVVPSLTEINPAFISTMSANAQRFQESQWLLEQALAEIRQKAVEEQDGLIRIDQQQIPATAASTVLYELLKPYQFNSEQVQQILFDQHAQSGAQFHSPTHTLTIDRTHYLINAIAASVETKTQACSSLDSSLDLGSARLILQTSSTPPPKLQEGPMIAWLDADQLTLPLTIRRWRAGDRFQPLGMDGQHQSLQDFFTHQKLSRPEKEKVWLLENARGEICWIIGKRIDERAKISATTQVFTRIEYQAKD